MVPESYFVTAILKDGQRYVFIVDERPENLSRFYSTLGRFAGDPGLNFCWRDAAHLANQMLTRHQPASGFVQLNLNLEGNP